MFDKEDAAKVGMDARRLARIEPALRAYVNRGVYAGMSTMIARRGIIVHAEQFGMRDKEAGLPMTADTSFRIYSMTKPIVCTALMTLVEEGRLRIFDPVAKYIPSFGRVQVMSPDGALSTPSRPMQVRDLMMHTSGLSYNFVDSHVSNLYLGGKLSDAACTLEEAVEDIARLPLAYDPGTRWHYSVGIDVAARVCEVASGQPFAAFLKERLFAPLKMHDTAFEVPAGKRDHLAAMYGRPDLLVVPGSALDQLAAWRDGVNDRLDVSVSYPTDRPDTFQRGGHGLFSTIGDYWRFAQMLANNGQLEGERILGRKTLELMHANHLPPSLLPLEIAGLPIPGYGFGLGSRVMLDVAANGAPGSVGEFGWAGAANTYYWVDPKEQLVGLFMAQSMSNYDLAEIDFRTLAYQAIVD